MGHPIGNEIIVADSMGYRLEQQGVAEVIELRPVRKPVALKPMESDDDTEADESDTMDEDTGAETGAETGEDETETTKG